MLILSCPQGSVGREFSKAMELELSWVPTSEQSAPGALLLTSVLSVPSPSHFTNPLGLGQGLIISPEHSANRGVFYLPRGGGTEPDWILALEDRLRWKENVPGKVNRGQTQVAQERA